MPTNTRAAARAILHTTDPALTFQPARYRKIYPTYNPTIAAPRTQVVQFSLCSSLPTLRKPAVQKNRIALTAAPVRYVIISVPKAFTPYGVDFWQML